MYPFPLAGHSSCMPKAPKLSEEERRASFERVRRAMLAQVERDLAADRDKRKPPKADPDMSGKD
ncbi:MAG: hypothetical protein ACXW27_06770 [Allosphingosinicella sp.]